MIQKEAHFFNQLYFMIYDQNKKRPVQIHLHGALFYNYL